jgi:hypothetical protein
VIAKIKKYSGASSLIRYLLKPTKQAQIVSSSMYAPAINQAIGNEVVIESNDFKTALAREIKTSFDLFNWWVSNGSEESLDLFVETQAKFPQAKHILVLNQGNFQYIYDWKRFRLSKPIADLYHRHLIKIVRMPFLSVEPGFWQSKESVPYHKIIGDNTIDEFVRDAIETWTIKAFDEIEQTTWL